MKEHDYPGIYAIINRTNGKLYVGSAVSVYKRWVVHRSSLSKGCHKNPYLQRAFDKHGADALDYAILERVDDIQALLSREQHYIDTLSPAYNICRTAGSNLGTKASETTCALRSAAFRGKPKSPEHREKLRQANLGKKQPPEVVAKSANSRRGRAVSEETKAKMRDANLGRKWTAEQRERRMAAGWKAHSPEHTEKLAAARRGKLHSEETKARMRESAKRRGITPEQRVKMNRARHPH